ncbi:GNAT family N-acetyltransferase [Verrucomicrobiaceae bacterium E54]|nr:GNAT family N-acetyltransferase [Verrucomicrobiaceae bacterium E54]
MKVERMNPGRAGADETWIAHDGGGERGQAGLWWSEVPSMPGEMVGCIGGFEAVDREAAQALLTAACDRLREVGCSRAIGPMDGNTWRRHRFVVEPGERPPFFLEPSNPPDWPGWWQDEGFSVLSRYSSSRLVLGEAKAGMDRIEQRLADRGVRVRELDPARFEDELRLIHRLSLESFAGNFLYTPLAEPEFVAMYAKVRELVRPGLVWLAEDEDGLAGFVFSVPDALAMQRGEPPDLIVKTLAVKRDRRTAGLGSLLVDRVQSAGLQAGFTHAIHALQHEANTSLRITGRFGGSVMRRYALLSKPL